MRAYLMGLLLLALAWGATAADDLEAAIAKGDVDRVTAILADDPAQASAPRPTRTPLLSYAVETGQPTAVKTRIIALLLEHDADPCTTDLHSGTTPLMAAITRRQDDVAKLLITFGRPALGRRNNAGDTALHLAVREYRTEMVAALLAGGLSPDVTDAEGKTALHHAAKGYHVPIMQRLIDNGARIDCRDVNGDVPLHAAITSPHSDWDDRRRLPTVRWLLDHGASPNAQNWNGHTALHVAVRQENVAMLAMLCAAGADPGLRDNLGATALDTALDAGKVEIARALVPLTPAAALNAPAVRDPVLVSAARNAATAPLVEALLAQGADPNVAGADGYTALMRGAGDASVVRALLAKGARADAVATDGTTALHMAGVAGNGEVVGLLLAAGAEVTATNRRGQTPLHLATTQDVVARLLAAGADPKAVDVAGRVPAQAWAARPAKDLRAMLEAALAAGLDINTADRQGRTLLHLCAGAGAGAGPAVDLLLARGTRPDTPDRLGYWPVHRLKSVDVVTAFAAHKIALDTPRPDGQSPLARHPASTDVAKALLSAGMPAHAPDAFGRTVLHLTTNKTILDAALAATADLNPRDRFGFTPLGLLLRLPPDLSRDAAIKTLTEKKAAME